MKNNYWTRLRDVLTFLIIFIGPGIVGHIMGYPQAYATVLGTWVPAIFITEYLAGD